MAQKVTSTDIKLALKEFHNGKPSYFITECKTCSTYFPDPQGLLKFDGLAITKSYTKPNISKIAYIAEDYDIPCVQISVRTEHRDLYVEVAVEGTYHVGGSELDIVTDTIYELTQAGILEVVPEESEGK